MKVIRCEVGGVECCIPFARRCPEDAPTSPLVAVSSTQGRPRPHESKTNEISAILNLGFPLDSGGFRQSKTAELLVDFIFRYQVVSRNATKKISIA
jgi:hypothetical protein